MDQQETPVPVVSEDPIPGQVQSLNDLLSCQPEEIRTHMKLIRKDEHPNNGIFLRIDKNPPEKFIPNLPKTSMKGENNTVARVTVAPSLVGCLIGYFRAEYDVVYSGTRNTDGEVGKGGYVISQFDADVFVRPDDTLVPQEVERSDEHWLLPYDAAHAEYTATPVGKCFLSDITYINRGGKVRPVIHLTLWVEVSAEALEFAPGIILEKGYYQMKLRWSSLADRSIQEIDKELLKTTVVTEAEYRNQKRLSADLLSYQDAPAPHAFW